MLTARAGPDQSAAALFAELGSAAILVLTPRTVPNGPPYKHASQLRVWLMVLGRCENSHDSFWCINAGQPGDLIKITIQAGNDFNT